MSSYQQHPLSAAFPSMSADAFAELRVDIAANGLHSPITLYEDKVLDGWHRYTCCQQTGTAPRFTTFQGDDAAARRFVVSVNLLRRHLDTSQRAMIAARFASIPQGRPIVANKGAISPVCSQTVAEAATLVNVGDRAVKDARVVLAQASPEVIAAVEAGDMSVSRAAKETRAATPRPVAPKPATPAPAPAPAAGRRHRLGAGFSPAQPSMTSRPACRSAISAADKISSTASAASRSASGGSAGGGPSSSGSGSR